MRWQQRQRISIFLKFLVLTYNTTIMVRQPLRDMSSSSPPMVVLLI